MLDVGGFNCQLGSRPQRGTIYFEHRFKLDFARRGRADKTGQRYVEDGRPPESSKKRRKARDNISSRDKKTDAVTKSMTLEHESRIEIRPLPALEIYRSRSKI
jgi:hypothetical protein